MSGEKGWANPGPAGLVALAVACFIFYALLSGTVKAGALPLMGCWLLGGFVIQFIVALIELMEGKSTGGNVFLIFSAFFMATGSVEMFVKYFAALNKWAIPLDGHVDGWAWLALAIFLVAWTPAYFHGTSILATALIIVDVSVVCVAFMDIGILNKEVGDPLAAYCFLGCGILALYLATAIIMNTEYGKSILPITGPWIK